MAMIYFSLLRCFLLYFIHIFYSVFLSAPPPPPHSVQGFPLLAATAPFFFSLRNVTRVALDVIKV